MRESGVRPGLGGLQLVVQVHPPWRIPTSLPTLKFLPLAAPGARLSAMNSSPVLRVESSVDLSPVGVDCVGGEDGRVAGGGGLL